MLSLLTTRLGVAAIAAVIAGGAGYVKGHSDADTACQVQELRDALAGKERDLGAITETARLTRMAEEAARQRAAELEEAIDAIRVEATADDCCAALSRPESRRLCQLAGTGC